MAEDFRAADATVGRGAGCSSPGSSLSHFRDGITRGDIYLGLAQRRFGLIESGLLGVQCHFLAGMYLMYTLRPLRAWSQFDTASRQLYVYLRCQAHRPAPSQSPPRFRLLEQRLYWSCYKAQSELQMDLDLPPSPLAGLDYPDMYPSPPETNQGQDLETP